MSIWLDLIVKASDGSDLPLTDNGDGTNSMRLPASGDSAVQLEVLSGMAFQKQSLVIVEDTGSLYMEVEADGGGDVTYLVDSVESVLDCTTGAGTGGKARVLLTAGADANNPERDFVYVTDTAGVATLVASTTQPSGAFAWVGKTLIPDATTWATTGAYSFQRFTDSFLNDSRGAISHEREKIRVLGATYREGVAQTLNITTNAGAADNVHLATGVGKVYQLHLQDFPAFSTGPYYYGNGQTPFLQIADLNLATSLQDGTAISDKDRYVLVVWGAVNVTTGECKLFVNLPNAYYNSDSEALADSNNTGDYSVPDGMGTVAFLIARVVISYKTSDSGTFTSLGVLSLLGSPLGVHIGGSGIAAASDFDDAIFRVYDDGDETKRIAFQAAGITTATTRTITMPDADVALVATPIDSVVGGTDITVDETDPANPIVNYTGTGGGDIITYGALEYLNQFVANNTVDEMIFELPAGYDGFQIRFSDVESASGSDDHLGIQVSTDGGATYIATSYKWSTFVSSSSFSTPSGSTNSTYASAIGGLSTGQKSGGQINLTNFGPSLFAANCHGQSIAADAALYNRVTGINRTGLAAAVTHIRLFMPSTSNIKTGTFTLYGFGDSGTLNAATYRAIAQAGAQAVALAAEEQVHLTTDNTTATITLAAPSAGEMTHAQLRVTDGGSGNDLSFPVGAKWASGSKPDMSAGDWMVGGSLDPTGSYVFTAASL